MSIKLVVIDDQRLMCSAARALFIKNGVAPEEIEVFTSSLEFVEIFSSDPDKYSSVGLFLIDMHMPEMPGIDLAKKISKSANLPPSASIVIMSSDDTPKSVMNALDSGATTFCKKPLSASTVPGLIENLRV